MITWIIITLFLAVALIVVILIFAVMLLFSGFLISLASIFSWLSWIQWISAFRYASNMLTLNEFLNNIFCLANSTSICPMNGTEVLEKLAIDYATSWDMWKNVFALTMLTILFLLLGFIQLFRSKKNKWLKTIIIFLYLATFFFIFKPYNIFLVENISLVIRDILRLWLSTK